VEWRLGHVVTIEPGEVLVVTKLHRLARSALELLRIVDQIGKEGAGFKSLGEPWAGTKPRRPSHADRLSGIAEFERDPILQRTIEGYARPRLRGAPHAEADEAPDAKLTVRLLRRQRAVA
jgi:DNA invertase Pin-like site-specific DNA recombinase